MALLLRVRGLRIRGYDSASEAICATEQQTARARPLLQRVIGAHTLTYSRGADEVVLSLSNSWHMRIGCGPNGVTWSANVNVGETPRTMDDLPLQVRLSIANADPQEGRFLVSWDRRSLLDKLIGRAIRSIQLSSPFLFLYADACPMMCFCVFAREDTGGFVLHWDVDE